MVIVIIIYLVYVMVLMYFTYFWYTKLATRYKHYKQCIYTQVKWQSSTGYSAICRCCCWCWWLMCAMYKMYPVSWRGFEKPRFSSFNLNIKHLWYVCSSGGFFTNLPFNTNSAAFAPNNKDRSIGTALVYVFNFCGRVSVLIESYKNRTLINQRSLMYSS